MANMELTVRPDAKGRITLGELAKGVSSFRIRQEPNGNLVLEPYKEIPAREAWLYENTEALERVRNGLADAVAGRLRQRGDFSAFVDDADE